LLRKISGESLASPEKKQRERRVRSGTTDIDVGKNTRLMYAKTLAKSVVKKQASTAKINVIGKVDLRVPASKFVKQEIAEETLESEAEEDNETSIWCGDEEESSQDREVVPTVEITEEEEESSQGKEVTPTVEISDEEDDSVVDVRQRRQRLPIRRIAPDSDDESEATMPEDEVHESVDRPTLSPRLQQQAAEEEPEPLTSMKPPHRKGHSTISNWAQEVIDLTESPESPTSCAPTLPPPTRMRSASFASSRPQTSESHGDIALLTYSPTPKKLRSPCKAPPMSRPATPPLAPSSPSKLVSPSKKKSTIPKAPDLRPSLDAFWNPEVVNEWNEQHSPSKPLVSPRKQKWRDDIVKMMEGIALDDNDSSNSDAESSSPTTSPRKKTTKAPQPRSPTKKVPTPAPTSSDPSIKALRTQRKAFSSEKHALAEAFLLELDNTITSGRISSLSASTGGIKLVWSRTLKTTAGRANWRREVIRLRTGPQASDFSTEIRHHCTIELAEKVIDDHSRLYNVLAHEFCHLTTFMISNVRNNPHGADFKSWGQRVSCAFAHLDVVVTTKHSYAIEFKYIWECVDCGYLFKRHSKSIDTQRHSCGKCKGRLAQTKPAPRNGGGMSEYQVFVKKHFARVKAEMEARGEETGMGRVVERVAGMYREEKGRKEMETGLEKELGEMKI
jgi:predicted SprT family Zn-dependent metalloprotease